MRDVLIIGSGPAGISAAIYTARAGLKTTVIGKDNGALEKAEAIENYYGFAQPISGDKLIADGITQAKRFGAQVITDQVVGITYEGDFTIKCDNNELGARSVIIATGSNRTTVKMKGFADYEGKGISYCALCDAFFYRGKDVAVLGCCEYALHEAMELLPIAKSVTLLTNGVEPITKMPKEIAIIKQEIRELIGGDYLERVTFSDGTTLSIAGLFVAIGVAGSADLAKKLGAQTEGLRIIVDENMATNIPGLYAAGDCTGGLLQISKAVYEGAKAGTEVIKFIRRNGKS